MSPCVTGSSSVSDSVPASTRASTAPQSGTFIVLFIKKRSSGLCDQVKSEPVSTSAIPIRPPSLASIRSTVYSSAPTGVCAKPVAAMDKPRTSPATVRDKVELRVCIRSSFVSMHLTPCSMASVDFMTDVYFGLNAPDKRQILWYTIS